MKLAGLIFEKINKLGFNKKRAVLYNEFYIYNLTNKELETIYSLPNNCIPKIACDGLWLVCNDTSSYYDVFKNNLSFSELKYRISQETYDTNKYFISKSIGGKPFKLTVFEKYNLHQNKIEFNRIFTYSFDDNNIYVRSNGYKILTCYDYKLKSKWEYNLKGQIYLDFERKPQLHNNLVIINHAWDIIALDKKTGKEAWKYTFEDIPTSNILMEGKIYAVSLAQLYVINPDNGVVLSKADTGYQPYWSDGERINNIGVFPVGNYLYGVAQLEPTGKTIKLYDKQCNLLYQTSLGSYGLNQNASLLPVIRDNKIYQPVKSAYSLSGFGLLVLELTDNDTQAGVDVAPRPPHIIMASPSLKKPHKLQIFLDVDNIDDALRYGELLTEELHYATGYITIYEIRENALDTKHNGEIELIIDDTGYTKEAEASLSRLSDKLKESLECGMKMAGDKKTAIKFTLLTQPKAEWDKSGEQLDLPAIREQETPLV